MNTKIATSVYILTLVFSLVLIFPLYSGELVNGAVNEPALAFWNLDDEIEILKKKVQKASPGVVFITAFDSAGEEINSGSGFFLDKEGKILTNENILKDAYSAEVKSKSQIYDMVTILSMDEQSDLAMIRVNAVDESPLELALNYRLSPEEKVLIIGKSDSLKDTVAEGIVTSISKDGELAERIEIKKAVPITYFPANRDGPVLNKDGKVIGIRAIISEHSIFGKDAVQMEDKKVSAVSVKAVYSLLSAQQTVKLRQAGSTEAFAVLKKLFTNAFIFLYDIGFPKLLGIAFVIVIFISLIQWCLTQLKKKFNRAS